MEFQFGTNWARFSKYAGGVIGQTLAMEGMFAFFLESSFLGAAGVWASGALGRAGAFRGGAGAVVPEAGCRAISSSARMPSCSIQSGTQSGVMVRSI